MRVQPVDAAPSKMNVLVTGGVYDAKEADEAEDHFGVRRDPVTIAKVTRAMLEAQPPHSVRKLVVGYFLGKQNAQGVQCVF